LALIALRIQILYAVSSRDLRPTLPKSCPPEIAAFLNACWNKTPEDRPDFPTIIGQLRDLQVIFKERKAAWDKTIGATWREENAQTTTSTNTEADITSSQIPTAQTTTTQTTTTQTTTTENNNRNTHIPGNANPAIVKSVSSSQVNNDGTTQVTGSRKISDAGKQSVVTAEFSFKREKSFQS
jgi:hypothetical protein